ncbi:hypothetical protein PRK78_000996 [Emydomyces testavorans]|uniref:Peroxin 20 n=1 Tax=Emydomyces testavorans TaxID=2070801 RepID=A0AAF0DCK4_9EURO|nr:hypothetical protein PRK78_000996 [Emydomyces testavorans]
MGDTLCGPANPLQNLQKHTSTDRTLQQDRIISGQSPVQGFRSRNPNEGILDPEFQAFESGFSGLDFPHVHTPPVFAQSSLQLPQLNHHGDSSQWASDFQSLQISAQSPSVLPRHLQAQTRVDSPVSAGWHDDFMNQSQASRQSSMLQKGMIHSPAMNMQFQPLNADNLQATQLHDSQAEGVFDESAFEAAFAEARAEVELQESKLQKLEEEEESTDDVLSSFEPIRIGSDTIPAQQEVVDEADELARTAGQLLESVSHDESQKFKESNFLALMRQLRDREVTVEGDEFREVSTLS